MFVVCYRTLPIERCSGRFYERLFYGSQVSFPYETQIADSVVGLFSEELTLDCGEFEELNV